ncbi:MAG: glycosyltransferase family 2 protein [Streptosporangiales bacterium]|jgi:cellulose synthase/poly-beta-1,6-N-acetylglucosamine synthase-like glycosyltransferase|nr:glycosyltransferase family 2 protein [Streptosporangiales bacterium]
MSLSCLRFVRRYFFVLLAALAAALFAGCYLLGLPMLDITLLLVTAFNLVIGGLEARWRLYGWRVPEAKAHIAWPIPVEPGTARMTFSLIVPCKDEADVIGDTLRGLLRQTHPWFEIVVTLCHDDQPTIDAVHEVLGESAAGGRITVVTGRYRKSSKAQQLNRALQYCAGDVVGVIDAEDDVAEDLLVHTEALFEMTGADVVQGGVQLMNLGRGAGKWFQVHNVLEYFFWFTSRMAFHAEQGFVPLGGNTVFIRRALLNEAGGWPPRLTEDCSLGVKLSVEHGAKVATAYSAELTTREEAPPSIFNKRAGSLFWQRDRWVRGFLQEFADGKWLRMPTLRQKVLAGYILATPMLQAFSFILMPVAIGAGIFFKAPIGIAMLMFAPLLPVAVSVLSMLFGLHEFCRSYGQRASIWHYVSVLLLSPLYQLILAGAAAVAVYKYTVGDETWYKTGRMNSHRGSGIPAPRAPAEALSEEVAA